MAKESVEILNGKVDVNKVIEQLNSVLSEEWMAYYQYWVASFIAVGPMRYNIEKEFREHAMEEVGHASMLAERIIELEGTPVLDPQKWFSLATCKYEIPSNFDTVVLLNQNIHGEQCAIAHYEAIAEYTHGKDFTTCDLAKKIMAVEEKHEQDLQEFLDDIQSTIRHFMAK